MSWLSTHYDKSEWNNCFIIYKLLINLFSILEYHLSRQITKQSALESAVLFQFMKQTPEFICMNGFNVCFKFIMKFFFIFLNLPLRILTPYSVAFFVFSGVAFSKRATISTLVGSANLAAILNFTTHRI